MVGTAAENNRRNGEIAPSGHVPLRIENPAGLGALAMTVNPPPATEPATNIYRHSSLVPSTREPKYVSAALSVIAVRAIAPQKRMNGGKPPNRLCNHHFCRPPKITKPAKKKPTISPSRISKGFWCL